VAIDGHKEILELSAKDETSQRAGGNASPSISIDDELSITHGWCVQTEKHRKPMIIDILVETHELSARENFS